MNLYETIRGVSDLKNAFDQDDLFLASVLIIRRLRIEGGVDQLKILEMVTRHSSENPYRKELSE